MRKCLLVLSVLFFALQVLLIPAFAADHADRIFVNGKIWTADDAHPMVEALAVRGDKLLAVGSNADVRKLASADTAIVDLHGRLLMPGFNDAHWHFSSSDHADLVDSVDVSDLQRRLARYAEAHPAKAWITGRGWGYSAFPGKLPEKKYLDAVMPDRPVFIWERDGHMGLANSKALALAGVTRDTPDPANGRIERDAHGEPTGELKESAVGLVAEHIPAPSAEDRYEALKKTLDEAASYGLTSVQEVSQGWGSDESAYLRVLAEGGMKVRFYMSVPFRKNPKAADLELFKSQRDQYKGPVLKFGCAKGMLDGTVDARTAAMFEPYVGGGTGIPMWTQEELDQAAAAYDRAGLQIMLHAIGDKAIHMALDSFEYAAKTNGTSGRRHRVEHMEVPRLDDLPRFKQLGVIASTQALFANPDDTTLNNYAVLLGPARASHANAFKLIDDAGAVQAFGSDHPVFSHEALRGIYCAVARKTPEGAPAGGWYPENRISVEAALRHFTRDGAYASFDENVKGTLTAGKLADFVVLSEDILSGPPEKILKAKVLLTVMGGRDSYRAAEFQ